MNKPGKYDAECARVKEACKAKGAMLFILKGEKGNGISLRMPGNEMLKMPALLRQMARELEADIAQVLLEELQKGLKIDERN